MRFRRGRWWYRRLRGRWRPYRHRRRRRYRHRRGHWSFANRIKRAFHNPHPGNYIVRRARPYNTMDIFFQGVVMFPVRVSNRHDQQISYRVASMDINLYNMIRATYYPQDGGPTGNTQGTTTTGLHYPNEWWRWAWLSMSPTTVTRLPQQVPMTEHDCRRLFGYFQIFKHIKTRVSILSTENYATYPMIVASLGIQDDYFRNQSGIETQKHRNFPTFLELSAMGAPWSFPPGQRSVNRGSFNHHTFSGTNDPMGEPWKWLNPIGNQPGELDWTVGTIYLAAWEYSTGAASGGTFAGPNAPIGSTNTWAIARVKSWWRLGNRSRTGGNWVTWPGPGNDNDMQ